ncbi:hypothetical protein QUF64_00255 [Anaerolineales bacterium HSG6]|nr:hypothetical protein [Anaerolineales bacterium HSG6]
MDELQLRVILGLFLPLITLTHAIWANEPTIFMVAFTVGLVWAIYRELFWVRTCIDAIQGLFSSNLYGHNRDATSVTYSNFVRHEAVEVTLVA